MPDQSFAHPRAGELHPQAAALLAQAAQSTRPNAHLLPVAEARANFESDFAGLGPLDDVAEIRDLELAVGGTQLPARLYRPSDAVDLPVVVYFHGGGWLLGSVDSHDAVGRALAAASGAAIVSVGYRRGPEERFPTAAEDCYAATLAVVERASELGIDGTRLAVAGDSAGGNLAAAVAIMARDRGRPDLAFQLLVYPVTTTDLDVGFDMAYEGFFLYREELQWHQDNYLASPDQRDDPLVSPLGHADLVGLPPAMVVTAGCDPLHAQGELYAQALDRAAVPTQHRHWSGAVHGFFQLPMLFDDGQEAIAAAGDALRAALAGR